MKQKLLIRARDSFFATVFILLSAILLSQIDLNIEFLNPVEKTLGDFKLTDIYYSHVKENEENVEDIVVVNIGNLPRAGIADLVNVISENDPAVIGIDAFFPDQKEEDPMGDFKLVEAFSKVENLVLVSELIENIPASKKADSTIIDSIKYSHPMFMQYATPGFADMVSEGYGKFNTSRECVPKQYFQDTILYSFPVTMVNIKYPEKVKRFVERGNDVEDINYLGNLIVNEVGATANSKITFSAIDWDDVLNRKFVPDVFKDKIVFMGYLGSELGENSWTDKFFTPLNEEYLGKTMPDMYGVVVHANIAGMIINESYINHMPEWLYYLLTIIFIFINVWLFSYMFFNWSMWYDGASLLVSIIQVFSLMGLLILVYHIYSYRIDITLPIVALFLMGNLIEIYFGIFHQGYSKIRRKYRIQPNTLKPKTQETYEV